MYFVSAKRGIPRVDSIALVSAGMCGLIVAFPAAAQEEVWPSNAEAHPGEIVYSRDVPYGIATRRFAQGEARTVAPDQTELIIDSLLVGLKPLSDAEQASVAAPIGRSLGAAQNAIDTGLSALSRTSSNGDFSRSESGASATGSVVSRALSVLPSALGAIGKATGGGK